MIGLAWQGRSGLAGGDWCGLVVWVDVGATRFGQAGEAGLGSLGLGTWWRGESWHGRHDPVRLGKSRRGMAGFGLLGAAGVVSETRQGSARRVEAWRGRRG